MSGPGAEVEVPHDESDPYIKKVALSVAIYAVVLVLAGAGGSNAGKDMLMGQMQASNEWSRYQAKVLREVMLTQERESLEQFTELSERQKQRLAFITAKLAEYKKEKEEISDEAKKNEGERDVAHRKDPYFDFAEMVLQIGVVLASISMLSKARWPYLVSLLCCVVGVFLTLNGYFLFARVPFIDAGH
jgi:hypothetical protein